MSAADAPNRLGIAIGERRRPLRERRTPSLPRPSAGTVSGPGDLGRRSRSFSLGTGLSLSSRRSIGQAIPDDMTRGLPVAPPAEWDGGGNGQRAAVSTGDPALDRIIAASRRAAPAG